MKPGITNSVAALLAASALTLASCAEEEWFVSGTSTVADPVFELYDTDGNPLEGAVRMARSAGDASLAVVSNADWTAEVTSEDAEWLSVNPPSNHGDGRLLLRAKYNSGVEAREATVTITYNGTKQYAFSLVQSGAPLLSVDHAEVAMFRNVYTLTVSALSSWTATVLDDAGSWVHLDRTEGDAGICELSVVVDRNTGGAVRSAVVEFDNDGALEYFRLEQRGSVETLAAQLTEDDVLKMSWNELFGARGYRVAVYVDGSEEALRTAEFDEHTTSCSFLYTGDGLFAGLSATVRLDVEALVDDPDFRIVSAPLTTHTLFDAASGDGRSESTAYVIATRRHLNNVRHELGGYFRQTADIDLSGYEPEMAASYMTGNLSPFSSASTPFTGCYDGGGHAISNLKIHYPDSPAGGGSHQMLGLFGVVSGTQDAPAVLKNIRLLNPDILNDCNNGSVGPSQTGALAAQTLGYVTVDNCAVVGGSVSSTCEKNNMIAGLIGNVNGRENYVLNSRNEGCTVLGWGNVAGLIGQAQGTAVTNCSNTGDVSGQQNIGGIAGSLLSNAGSTMQRCFNTGRITTLVNMQANIGGLVGRTAAVSGNPALQIDECFNAGRVDASVSMAQNNYCGGIVGLVNSQKTGIANSYNSGEILKGRNVNDATAGGIIGGSNVGAAAAGNKLTNCYNVGTVTDGYGINGTVTNAAAWKFVSSYALEAVSAGASKGNLAGTALLTEAEMKDLSNFTGWDAAIWRIDGSAGYPYPQLTDNPHATKE